MPRTKRTIRLEGTQNVRNNKVVTRQKTIALQKDQIVISADFTMKDSDRYYAEITEIKVSGSDRYLKILYKPVGIRRRPFFSVFDIDIFYEIKDEFGDDF